MCYNHAMTYTLFIDDERHPTPDLVNVRVARSLTDAHRIVGELGAPSVISFDHDLGEVNGELQPTGFDCLHWLIDQHLDAYIDLGAVQQVIAHSNNPAGAANIAGLWDNFAAVVLKVRRLAIVRPRNSLID